MLSDLLDQQLVVIVRGPAFDLYSLTPAGRAQLAELSERNGAAPAMAVALCGNLTAACEVRKRPKPDGI